MIRAQTTKCYNVSMKSLIIKTQDQVAELWDNSHLIKSFKISTASNGLSCVNDSFCTPDGKLRVAEKIGEGYPIGAVFKSRVFTGEVWPQAINDLTYNSDDDLVLTRILWLEGAEEKNLNTLHRHIYLHGTNHENKLGHPVSHGCIRFSNSDIIEIFDQLEVGSEVFVS